MTTTSYRWAVLAAGTAASTAYSAVLLGLPVLAPVLREEFDLTLTEVGQVFARDRTTVAHACTRVEDLRDDPAFDRALELLESVMRMLVPSSAPRGRRLRAGT